MMAVKNKVLPSSPHPSYPISPTQSLLRLPNLSYFSCPISLDGSSLPASLPRPHAPPLLCPVPCSRAVARTAQYVDTVFELVFVFGSGQDEIRAHAHTQAHVLQDGKTPVECSEERVILDLFKYAWIFSPSLLLFALLLLSFSPSLLLLLFALSPSLPSSPLLPS